MTGNKIRPFLVCKILYEQTDDTHFLTLAEIAAILKEDYGIEVYRTTLKEDIDTISEMNVEIECIRSTQNKYHIVDRPFAVAEIKMLIDAVISASFISPKESRRMVDKLSSMLSIYEKQDVIDDDIESFDACKTTDNKTLYYIDAVNEAIRNRKKIRFQIFYYSGGKNKIVSDDGEYTVISPIRLLWKDSKYIVIGINDKTGHIDPYRIDRILNVPEVLKEPAADVPEGFDISVYMEAPNALSKGELVEVTLECNGRRINSVIDRFSNNMKILSETGDKTVVRVTVRNNPLFYGWIFGKAGQIRIVEPEEAVKTYKKLVDETYARLNK